MKACYRFLLMLLFALPALNVLAAGMDMAMANRAGLSEDCIAHAAHASCHQHAAGKLSTPGSPQQSAHALPCSSGCVQHCAPALLLQPTLSVALWAGSGILQPIQPPLLAGITLSPPHRPPLTV
ncbi:hypothetical protein DLM_1567 [Aquitalea magnusonii]|uniref:CopL family metal-binding regulatory protein n=1 Tax=Aquitalea magnusonii TaxID=332411 RepID=A0A3G9GI43_9NEIS|nr:hypothetical protein [Aquitalea magnusonii]BBF85186.1 hypothetical protein DLM_1567 [Aquitalea magnusonii]